MKNPLLILLLLVSTQAFSQVLYPYVPQDWQVMMDNSKRMKALGFKYKDSLSYNPYYLYAIDSSLAFAYRFKNDTYRNAVRMDSIRIYRTGAKVDSLRRWEDMGFDTIAASYTYREDKEAFFGEIIDKQTGVQASRFIFDTEGRVIEEQPAPTMKVSPLVHPRPVKYFYDERGRVVKYVLDAGNWGTSTTAFDYDERGRIRKIYSADNKWSYEYSYLENGLIKSVDVLDTNGKRKVKLTYEKL